MTKQSTSIKILIALFLLVITMTAVFAFPPEALGGASRPPTDLKAFTVAGQNRQCSQYADETGVFVGAKTIRSQSSPALVNIYYVTSTGGWTFYNEYSIPQGSYTLQFTGSNRQYAYEVYYCPVDANSCSGSTNRAVTERSYQTCAGGYWSNEIQCPTNQYFSTSTNTCSVQVCHEQWNCGQWGQCTADGKQYRSCADVNSCGSTKDRPLTSQSCIPVPSTGTTTGQVGSNIKLIGQPKLDAYTGTAGTPRVVTQTVMVSQAGSYWLEAGIETLRAFNIASTIEKNTCNPEETWYANKQIPLSPGLQNVTFTNLIPAADGEYVLHTAIVTGCAGEVVQQINAADHLIIGNPNNGASMFGLSALFGKLKGSGALLIIVAVALGVAALLVFAFTKKGRR